MFIRIDNFDSFTYNLYRYLSEIDASVKVYSNDKITINNFKLKNPTSIIIGLSHKQYPVHGVQFHPESIASECVHDILQNSINIFNNFTRKAA